MQLLIRIMAISLSLATFAHVGTASDYYYDHRARPRKHKPAWKKTTDDRETLITIIDRERAAHAATLKEAIRAGQAQMALCSSQAIAIEKLLQKINEHDLENKRLTERITILEEAIATLTTSSKIWSETAVVRYPSRAETAAAAIAKETKTKRLQEKEFLKTLEQKDKEIREKEAEIDGLREALCRVKGFSYAPFSPIMTCTSLSYLKPDGIHQIPEFKLSQ